MSLPISPNSFIELDPEQSVFLAELSMAEIDFIIVGGTAMKIYGIEASSDDLDIYFKPEESNVKKLIKIVHDMGYIEAAFHLMRYHKPLYLELGMGQSKIDLLNETPGLEFHEAYYDACQVLLNNVQVSVLSIEDLMSNKSMLQLGHHQRDVNYILATMSTQFAN
ncbi:nucleotidyltransferase [Mangrovivirga sp. M17]|uniref:Nucleotidyltransferase n=1 Tax=Mangrovivirga halotolerans TaxID=2993936 RepID=A0ABT3RMZ7_9BACT|nr:nucleotidyltransferase [Mangrovivirga halotolerans]MCX2742977.1 nucleotidyltransferase [Mangrovivirga halotolerans]